MTRIRNFFSIGLALIIAASAIVFEQLIVPAINEVLAVPWASRHLPPLIGYGDAAHVGLTQMQARAFVQRRTARLDRRPPMSFGVSAPA